MEEATHLAILITSSESLWRLSKCNPFQALNDSAFIPSVFFISSFIFCILTIFMHFRANNFFHSTRLRSVLKLLHALDGPLALFLGLGIYYESNFLTFISLMLICKFYLLHLLSRMVTGIKTHSNQAIALQTTKTFLHHVGSFSFLTIKTCSFAYERSLNVPFYESVVIMTSIWRFISMNGHAAMTLRDSISTKSYNQIMWTINHIRNIFMVFMLASIWMSPRLQRGFALSASGHISYMLVRMGPVFRIGSLYFSDRPDLKAQWEVMSDFNRLKAILSLKYPFFSLELALLSLTIIVLLSLRLNISIYIDVETCSFY